MTLRSIIMRISMGKVGRPRVDKVGISLLIYCPAVPVTLVQSIHGRMSQGTEYQDIQITTVSLHSNIKLEL